MMSSQCMVPSWNLKQQQRQEQVDAEEEANTSSYLTNNNNNNPMSSNNEIAELTWENGQPTMQGLGVGGLFPVKPTWGRSNETLESIVHQATTTCHPHHQDTTLNLLQHDQNSLAKMSSNLVASSGGRVPVVPGPLKKRTRPKSDHCGRNFSSMLEERGDRSACVSASARLCRDNDTTITPWAQYECPKTFKTKTTDEDYACHFGLENQDEDHETKTGGSNLSRRSRAAAIHNQSERRRRDRINQKLKALQRLIPNACKTDKVSMLDEVIDYLKQLQAKVKMMSNVRNNMPQMSTMMPLGLMQQQQLQMSLLAARMGMGMLDMNTMAARSALQSSLNPLMIHPTAPVSPFVVAPPAHANSDPGDPNASPVPLPDPYFAFLAQSMNVELYIKMAALFRQQLNQNKQQATSSPSTQSNHIQGD